MTNQGKPTYATPVNRARRTFSKALLAGGIAGTFATHAGAQSGSKYGIEGVQAPEIELDYWIDGDGKPTSFSVHEQRGKWVFLKCFQDWCPGCHSSGFPTLQKFSEAYHGHPKVAIAAIQTVFEGFGSNVQDDVRKNQLRYELPVPMGHDAGDPDGDHRSSVMRDYRTGGTPWLILINPEGVVVFNDFRVDSERLIEYIGEQVG